MSISTETLEKIRTKVNLVELVREYLPNLRQSGKNYKALCPFHPEKTPSFIVSPEKGIFHCFGCGVGGDIFGFLMRMENITFFEAIKKVARRAGIEIKEEMLNREFREIDEEKKFFYQIYEDTSLFYHWCLNELEEAKIANEYLKRRKISSEITKKFRLGYAPLSGDILRDALERKGYSLEQLVKARLLNFSPEKNRHYDFFSGRLIFTIFDSRGGVIAFGGRILNEEEGTCLPKYLNSAETLIFSKSRTLYGLVQATKAIHLENQAIICEGYFDVLALHQAGIENVVASLGTALTQEQMQILRRYTNRVLLLFDSDRAGMEAMERSQENLEGMGKIVITGLPIEDIEIPLETGIEMRVAILPSGCDPDEILQEKGKEFFLNLLEQAKDFFEFQIERIISKHDISLKKEKIAVAREILPLIAKIRDTLDEQAKIHYLAEELDLEEGLLNAEVKRLKNLKKKKIKSDEETSFLELGEGVINSPEEELFSLLLEDNTLLSLVIDKLKPDDFFHPGYIRLAKIIFTASDKLTPTYLFSILGEEDSSWISRLACREKPYQDKKKVILGLVSTIKRRRQERRWQTLAQEINAMLEGKMVLDQDKYKEYQELTKILKGSARNLIGECEPKSVHLLKE